MAESLDGRYRHNPVAPYQSCVACFKGDTQTGFALRGEPEFVVAGLMTLGIPEPQSLAMVSYETGCDPGMVPDRDVMIVVRCCENCAGKFKLGSLAGEAPEVPLYVQPDELRA